MPVHQCPKCELRFQFKTMLDDHCWHDHPQFRHDYPAAAPPHPVDAAPATPDLPPSRRPRMRSAFVNWLVPRTPGRRR